MSETRMFIFGTVISLFVGLGFYINQPTRPMGRLEFDVCVLLPVFTFIFILGIGALCKNILRGKIPFKEWNYIQAKDILLRKNTIFRKFLATAFLKISKLTIFIGGWYFGYGMLQFVVDNLK